MRKLLLISMACTFFFAQRPSPAPYNRFDPKFVFINPDKPKDTGLDINVSYLDKWINELAQHARDYPVSFANEDDKKKAYKDVEILIKILDVLNESKKNNPNLLRRAAFVNSMAHNLDVSMAAQRANLYYQNLLKLTPDDPDGNYMYGSFLGSVGKAVDAIPFLQKADSLGNPIAPYGLGMAYLMTGDNKKAIECFNKFRINHPDDNSIPELIEAIKNGNAGTKRVDVKN